MRTMALGMVVVLFGSLSLHAGTKVAIVGTEASAEFENALVLAEAELGKDEGIEVLDRKHLKEVLAEQKLALSGLTDPEQAIKVGKLLNVDLFVVVEAEPQKKKALGLVAFDSRSGVRMWDTSLTAEGTEETAAQIALGVKSATAKYRVKPGEFRTVGVLTVRNADLPRSMDPTVQMIGRLLERQLVQAPGVAVVERDRLRALIKEQSLPTKDPLPPLLASLQMIELEVGRGQSRDKTPGLVATARITDGSGKETATGKFEAEDSFTLATGLVAEILKGLRVKPSEGNLNRVKESDRFYAESFLRWRHREYEKAMTSAEAAHALQPEHNDRLKWLIDRIADAAIELIDPNQQHYGGATRGTPDPDKLEQSLVMMRHGADLWDMLYLRVQKKPDWYRDQNGLSAMWYQTYLSKVTLLDLKSQRQKEQVAEYVRAYRDVQMERNGKPLYEAAKAGKAFREYTAWVSGNALLSIFHNYSKVDPNWSVDAANVVTQWAELADAQNPSSDKQLMRSCDYVLGTVRWSSRAAKKEAADVERLRDTYAFLEARKDPVLNLHGRLLTLTLDRDMNKLPADTGRKHVEALVAKIEPYTIAPDGPTQDSETRRKWIDMALRANELLSTDERAEANRKLYALLESHGIYSSFAFYEVAANYQIRKNNQELAAFLSKGLEFLEKNPKGLLANERQTELVKLRDWHRTVIESLGKGIGAVTPWESVRTMIDVAEAEKDMRSIVRPVIVGRQVYALGMSWDKEAGSVSFTLMKFDLDGGPTEYLGTYTLEKLPPANFNDRTSLANGELNQLTVIERSTTEGSYFIRSACIVGDYYHAATLGRGILVYSLKGGTPHTIDEKRGLPSDHVQCLTSHQGTIYAWLGQLAKTAYLVRMKGDGSDVQVISSSRRTIKKTPLDNVSPVLCDFMMIDTPRKRLVFRLTNSNSDEVMGLWEMDLATDGLKQLKRTHLILSGYPPRVLPGERLLVKDDYVARVFDLKTNEMATLVRGEGQYPGSFLPFALIGDRLWTGFPFGSLDVKTRRTEIFPSLRAAEKMFQPGLFWGEAGEGEYVMGDPGGLWVVKVKKP